MTTTAPTSPTAPVVDVEALTKTFGRGAGATRALDGLDLTVAPGEVAGFLGPNGAGKTTTLRILLGMLRADGGRARLLGGDPWADAVTLHERLAYVPGDVALWPGLTGGQTLDALASLRARTAGPGSARRDVRADAARRAELLERFDLDPTKKVRTYSKGNRQKVALVAALSADVELLVLDEPTSGLDPLMEEVFRQYVAEAAQRGTAVLLSSHILGEVERLCDTVTIIRGGRTVEHGSLARIRSLLRTRVRAVVAADPSALAGRPELHDLTVTEVTGPSAVTGPDGLGGLVPALATTGGRGGAADGAAGRSWELELAVDPADLDAVTREIAALGVRSLTAAPPSLEELFLRHYATEAGDPDDVAGPGSPSTRPRGHVPAGSATETGEAVRS